MHRLPFKGSLYLFADNSALFYTGKCAKRNAELITRDLHVISEFFRINRLSLNVGKTKLIHFHTRQKKISLDAVVEFDGKKIEPENTVK